MIAQSWCNVVCGGGNKDAFHDLIHFTISHCSLEFHTAFLVNLERKIVWLHILRRFELDFLDFCIPSTRVRAGRSSTCVSSIFWQYTFEHLNTALSLQSLAAVNYGFRFSFFWRQPLVRLGSNGKHVCLCQYYLWL